MKVIGLIVLFLIIAIIDIPSVLKKNKGKFKFFVVCGFLLLAGFTVSLLQIIGKIPVSPAKIIEAIVKSVTGDM